MQSTRTQLRDQLVLKVDIEWNSTKVTKSFTIMCLSSLFTNIMYSKMCSLIVVYPLVIAMQNGHRNSWFFPIKSMVNRSIVMQTFTRPFVIVDVPIKNCFLFHRVCMIIVFWCFLMFLVGLPEGNNHLVGGFNLPLWKRSDFVNWNDGNSQNKY